MTVLKETDITEMRCIGKEREGFKRPILMGVRTTNMKMEILRKTNKLKGLEDIHNSWLYCFTNCLELGTRVSLSHRQLYVTMTMRKFKRINKTM